MGLITLVQPDERFWLLVSVDDADPTEIKHKIVNDEPSDDELSKDGWSAFECRPAVFAQFVVGRFVVDNLVLDFCGISVVNRDKQPESFVRLD